MKESHSEKQREKRRLKRSLGICIDCNEPVMAGKTRCEKHYHEQKERAAAWARQKRDDSAFETKEPVVIVGRPWWVSFEENYTHEKLEALNGRYYSR